MSLGQYEKAVESYKKAVKLDQNNGNRYFNLGYALATNEKAADAIKILQKLMSLVVRLRTQSSCITCSE